MSLLMALSVTAALVQAPTLGTAAVSGLVQEEGSGAPVADAQVNLIPLRSNLGPGRMPGPLLGATTDQAGRFQLLGLEAGRYRISAQKTGFASTPVPDPSTSLELGAGENHVVTLSLQRGAAIVGRVLSKAGEPVVDARVMALQKHTPRPPGSYSPVGRLLPVGNGAQTNDLGEFRLFELPAGHYYVYASPRPQFGGGPVGTRTLEPTYFPDVSDLSGAHSLSLSAGQTSDAIVIRMLEAPAFQVSGVVVDEAGRPVANAMVRMNADGQNAGPMFSYGRMLETRTNPSGVFTINNVTNDTYTLIAVAPVVTATSPDRRSGALISGSVWMGTASGPPGGPANGRVSTETRDGITTRYSDDVGTRLTITVNQAHVNGLQVVVRLPLR